MLSADLENQNEYYLQQLRALKYEDEATVMLDNGRVFTIEVLVGNTWNPWTGWKVYYITEGNRSTYVHFIKRYIGRANIVSVDIIYNYNSSSDEDYGFGYIIYKSNKKSKKRKK